MFGTLGGPELFLILIIALIVFGPRKLPEIGKSLGRTMAEFRKASHEFRQTIESEVEADKLKEAVRIEAPAAPAAAPAPVTPTAPGTAAETATAQPAVPAGGAGEAGTVSREAATPVEPK